MLRSRRRHALWSRSVARAAPASGCNQLEGRLLSRNVTDEIPDPAAFGASFMEFMRLMNAAARHGESPLAARMREHLGRDPRELPSTGADFALTDHPNLQLALDAVVPEVEVLGFVSPQGGFMTVGLSALLGGHPMAGPIEPGPVQYTDIDVGDGRVVRCVSAGVFLTSRDGAPVVLVISRAESPFGSSSLRVEGVSPQDGAVSGLLCELRAAMREHNVYRGRVISLHGGEERSVSVQFHTLPDIGRDAVVLPPGTLERLERHAIGVAEHAERLRSAGRQLKRGVFAARAARDREDPVGELPARRHARAHHGASHRARAGPDRAGGRDREGAHSCNSGA